MDGTSDAPLLEIEDGEEVVVDGSLGAVVRRPERARVARAMADAERAGRERDLALSRREESARTRDGHTIRVFANASTVPELREAMELWGNVQFGVSG